jgi:hypothetical protein
MSGKSEAAASDPGHRGEGGGPMRGRLQCVGGRRGAVADLRCGWHANALAGRRVAPQLQWRLQQNSHPPALRRALLPHLPASPRRLRPQHAG